MLIIRTYIFPLFCGSVGNVHGVRTRVTILRPGVRHVRGGCGNGGSPTDGRTVRHRVVGLCRSGSTGPVNNYASVLPVFIRNPMFVYVFCALSTVPCVTHNGFESKRNLNTFSVTATGRFASAAIFNIGITSGFAATTIRNGMIVTVFITLVYFYL